MTTFYSAVFFTGLFFTFLTTVLGSILEIEGFEAHFEEIDLPDLFFIPLKPIVLLPFITVFGGVGWLMTASGFGRILTVAAALLNAFAVGAVMYNLVFKKLKAMENTSSSRREEFIGMDAVVSESIMEGSFGSIKYENKGNMYRSPAKSMDGSYIPAGTSVYIRHIEDNVYYVEPGPGPS